MTFFFFRNSAAIGVLVAVFLLFLLSTGAILSVEFKSKSSIIQFIPYMTIYDLVCMIYVRHWGPPYLPKHLHTCTYPSNKGNIPTVI